MSFKVESDFIHNGMRCVVVFTRMGHRCGYVGINKEHRLYGVDYGQHIKFLAKESVENAPIGKRGIIPIMCWDGERITPEIYFDVHGGITYAGSGNYPVDSDLWWYGFDCAHAGDRNDYNKLREYGLANEKRIEEIMSWDLEGVTRSQDYVEQECKNLADQLAALVKKEGTNA